MSCFKMALVTVLALAMAFSGQAATRWGVTQGGTGTSTAFTTGSILFAKAGGIYGQDNTRFFWDDTNYRFALLNNSPTIDFSMSGAVARVWGLERMATAATPGVTLTIKAGGAKSGGTNLAGGDLILQPGVSTGTGTGGVIIKAYPAGGSGTADNSPSTVCTFLVAGITCASPFTAAAIAGTTGTFSAGISATTGTFSGGVTMTTLGATTGTFSGAVTATTFTGTHAGVTAGTSVRGAQTAVTSSSGAASFDPWVANSFKITLTESVTLSLSNTPQAGAFLTALVCQDGTGSHTWTWPGTFKGGFTVTATASKCDSQSFLCDGTNCYATSAGKQAM
jgi:hypothetical protein